MWHGDPQGLRLYIRAGDHLLLTPNTSLSPEFASFMSLLVYFKRVVHFQSWFFVFLGNLCTMSPTSHFSSSGKSVHSGRQTICEFQVCSWEVRALEIRHPFFLRFPCEIGSPWAPKLSFFLSQLSTLPTSYVFGGETCAPCVPNSSFLKKCVQCESFLPRFVHLKSQILVFLQRIVHFESHIPSVFLRNLCTLCPKS